MALGREPYHPRTILAPLVLSVLFEGKKIKKLMGEDPQTTLTNEDLLLYYYCVCSDRVPSG